MGFFNLSSNSGRRTRQSTITGCGACGLHKQCQSPKMGLAGKGRKGIFILAESPSALEDKRGKQLIGLAGQFLKKELARLGIDMDQDCWKMNAVNCHLSKNQIPSDAQITWCRPMVLKELADKKPGVIILLGGVAVKSFLGHRWHKKLGGISKWRGWVIPDRETGAWVCPTYHPSYVMRMDREPVIQRIFRADLFQSISALDQDFPHFDDEVKGVKVLDTVREVRKYLEMVLKFSPKLLAWDYETTGLKPHGPGQRIVSCSMSWNGKEAGAWMWELMDETNIKLFQRILTDPQIGKIASNMKYEHNWTKTMFGFDVAPWAWDTMLAGHILDNRPGISSIKMLAYLHCGVTPWDEHIEDYLRADHGNGLNNIDQVNPYDLLIYNGLDSIYEYQVAVRQMEIAGLIGEDKS